MGDNIDDVADELTVVQSGDGLSSVPVSHVEEDAGTVTVRLELPSGDQFDVPLEKPPVWGSNCQLQTLLDAYDIGPDAIDDLVGRTIPCDVDIGPGTVDVSPDVEALHQERGDSRVESPDFSGTDLE
jgi:hypothetical protein